MNRKKALSTQAIKLFPRLATACVSILWGLPVHAQQTGESTAEDGLFFFQLPNDNLVVMGLIGVIILSIVLGIGLYRSLLKRNVKNGTHPQVFAWSVVFAFAAFDLWLILAVLFQMDSIGPGIAAIVAGIFLFTLLLMMFVGKLQKFILLWVLFLVGLAIFQASIH